MAAEEREDGAPAVAPNGRQIRCHYEILGVPVDADDAAIKKAHRKMALRYHPDKNLDDADGSAEERFRLVQEAYETLHLFLFDSNYVIASL